MIPLVVKQVTDSHFPDFSLSRLAADLFLEPAAPDIRQAYTYCPGSLIDTASGYLVVPYAFHAPGHVKVYQELDPMPYRVISEGTPPQLQRFAEVGIRFLAKQPDGTYACWPEEFVRVKAYLLDAHTRPKKRVLIGLDALLEHFVTHLEKGNSYLKRPEEPGTTSGAI